MNWYWDSLNFEAQFRIEFYLKVALTNVIVVTEDIPVAWNVCNQVVITHRDKYHVIKCCLNNIFFFKAHEEND